ncbi:MAG TPA: hypothetical protein VJ875_24100 [Pyrinomonadaceae bacterium]|nr:hypothetical protein [Pyrinomonadaceae bacterium]
MKQSFLGGRVGVVVGDLTHQDVDAITRVRQLCTKTLTGHEI